MSTAPARTLLYARALRAFGDGFVSLLLPAYLVELGYGPVAVGAIATATLLGSGVLTLLVGYRAQRFRFRTLLLAAASLMTLTGVGFALVHGFWPLLVVAVVGTLNPASMRWRPQSAARSSDPLFRARGRSAAPAGSS